ncbi:MAG: aldehyde dehydrogenase family protein [bacterium]|nr:aldehyde dehydrogenase family protein [bacterium]
MLKDSYPYYLANRPMSPNQDLEVTDKFSGEVVTRVAMADEATLDKGIAAAAAVFEEMKQLRPYDRQRILYHCVDRFTERAAELAGSLCLEAGKPIRDSRGEVSRLIDTFRIAAEESVRIQGEVMNMEITPRAKGYTGMYKRFPVGPCSFITPFNFPLNLVAHKVAPAIAVGNPFVLKPASWTPVGAIIIGEILAETDLPEGAFSILPCPGSRADLLVTDDRLKHISFTGSPGVGWDIKARAGKKRVSLELGGNAACVVDEGSDIADAVDRIIFGAFYQSGQSCISVQRIMVHESLYEPFKKFLVEKTSVLKMGDPKDENTFIGPMISVQEAERLESWIDAAVKAGGKILCGGKRQGAMLEATLLENVPGDQDLCSGEAFGPVAVLSAFSDFDQVLAEVNDSVYGLQAGLFTNNINRAFRAWENLDVGGVIIGDIPSWRVDSMPYGGVKDSGFGREGIRFAMEEMTETRLLVIRDRDA